MKLNNQSGEDNLELTSTEELLKEVSNPDFFREKIKEILKYGPVQEEKILGINEEITRKIICDKYGIDDTDVEESSMLSGEEVLEYTKDPEGYKNKVNKKLVKGLDQHLEDLKKNEETLFQNISKKYGVNNDSLK